jgi:hypothetical protein
LKQKVRAKFALYLLFRTFKTMQPRSAKSEAATGTLKDVPVADFFAVL